MNGTSELAQSLSSIFLTETKNYKPFSIKYFKTEVQANKE